MHGVAVFSPKAHLPRVTYQGAVLSQKVIFWFGTPFPPAKRIEIRQHGFGRESEERETFKSKEIMAVDILIGDCRDVLKTMPSDSVDCCITSPPYWKLRSYLPTDHPKKHMEIGGEPTVHEWVQTMVEVFSEVRRVLKPSGTLWINLGDSYAGSRRGGAGWPGSTLVGKQTDHSHQAMVAGRRRDNHPVPRSDVAQPGLKPKDMVGQPWRVAFALQDAGWWLRQEIIWAKRSPIPESVRDRFTKSHEHVFLLAKQGSYYFDFDAIQEPASMGTHERRASTGVGFGHGYDRVEKPRARSADVLPEGVGRRQGPPGNPAERPVSPKAAQATTDDAGSYADGKSERLGRGPGWRNKQNASFDAAMATVPASRNPRSVRWLSSEPFRGAHFATYPPELIRPFVRAGCPPGGTVLDPFGGSGTTALVADQEGRNAILIDLDERNAPMASERITKGSPLFAQVTKPKSERLT